MTRAIQRGVTLLALGVIACGDSPVLPVIGVQLGAIGIDNGARLLELGTRDTVTATALDTRGDTVAVPVVWRSSNERVAIFERNGVIVARDTGVTLVTASSLGVTSQAVAYGVVWLGPASIDSIDYSAPHALTPGAILTDSVRVRVSNVHEAPVSNARVAFAVAGGGSVSPAIAITGVDGIAAAQWTIGSGLGLNTVTASVVRDDGTPNPFVSDNEVIFSVTSYDALLIVDGDGQTGQILDDLAQQPSVRLVDSLGNPRPGVPVQFTAFRGGRVTTPVVPTNSNGIATPGTWTLGDIPGEQALEARVADAKVRLRATGTGTPIHYNPARVSAGGFSTCAIEADASISCWGEVPRIGTGGTENVSSPTPVNAALSAIALAGGGTHFCALTELGALWCWGLNALMDTSGASLHAEVPTRMPSDIVWSEVSPGFSHNCGINTSNVAYCWGDNGNGQMGDGSTVPKLVPTQVQGGFTFSRIASGAAHTCALSTGGSAFCWGTNQFGQIGDGTAQQRTSPTAVSGGHSFQAIGSGEMFSCGLRSDGKVYCWGGISGAAQNTPVTYDGAPTFTSLSVGGAHACALTADAKAYCWGANDWGQLGDSSSTRRDRPTPVAGDLRFSSLSAGLQHTCALTTAGVVACWGRNRGGELGDADSAFQLTPRYLVLGVNPE